MVSGNIELNLLTCLMQLGQSNKGSIIFDCISCCLQLLEMNEVFDYPQLSDAVWLSCDYAE